MFYIEQHAHFCAHVTVSTVDVDMSCRDLDVLRNCMHCTRVTYTYALSYIVQNRAISREKIADVTMRSVADFPLGKERGDQQRDMHLRQQLDGENHGDAEAAAHASENRQGLIGRMLGYRMRNTSTRTTNLKYDQYTQYLDTRRGATAGLSVRETSYRSLATGHPVHSCEDKRYTI